jgi:hypothetical protein
MALQYSDTYRNALLDAFETSVGTAAKLQLRTGTQPATCATADSGTLIAELTLPSDWMNDASTGSKTKLGTWTGTASDGGTPAHFRVKNNAGSVTHMQGTVGQGSGDLSLDNTTITNGQTITISTFTLTAPGA